jgi:hypothetical protein
MAIDRHLRKASFDEATAARLREAYEAALTKLRLVDRRDPLTELVAGKIIEVFRAGEREPSKLCARALRELGVPETE